MTGVGMHVGLKTRKIGGYIGDKVRLREKVTWGENRGKHFEDKHKISDKVKGMPR